MSETPRLNEKIIAGLPVPEKGNKIIFFGGVMIQRMAAPAGFGVRTTASGSRSWVLVYRIRGVQHTFTIGAVEDWNPERAVRRARELRRDINAGKDPLEARKPEVKGETVAGVLDTFIERYAKRKLRGWPAVQSAFDRLVKPAIGKIVVGDLTRRDVSKMLDGIEDSSGPVMADRARAYVRKAMAWHEETDESFVLGKAFPRVSRRSEAAARARILSDDEIRILWPALGNHGVFGGLLKCLLLTAQRRSEVAGMTVSEVGADGVWEIPAERFKGKRVHAVPLSGAVLALIRAQSPVNGFLFPSSTGTAYSSFGEGKAAVDAAVPMAHWTLHDLRRTARSLMSRAGVSADVGERVIGHVIGGVRGVYDRHSYESEKRDAAERLASMIERIIDPVANVVPLARKA
jgi:integrase